MITQSTRMKDLAEGMARKERLQKEAERFSRLYSKRDIADQLRVEPLLLLHGSVDQERSALDALREAWWTNRDWKPRSLKSSQNYERKASTDFSQTYSGSRRAVPWHTAYHFRTVSESLNDSPRLVWCDNCRIVWTGESFLCPWCRKL
jgi:hypothetical protein